MDKLQNELLSPVAVVCHDAGAANHIFAWLNAWSNTGLLKNHEIRLILDGPARSIWLANKDINSYKLYDNLSMALKGVNVVLTGTGWASNLEYDAIKLAKNIGVYSIAVIDHWVNYRQRFIRNEMECLPNTIWVTDSDALNIARSTFEEISIKMMPNYYMENLMRQINPISETDNNLLYLLEPIRDDWNKGIPGEFQALDYFIKNLKKIVGNEKVNIKLRPHPSDKLDKYNEWIEENKEISPVIDSCSSLIESISNARWVVGAQTYGLVIAINAHRLTWSSLPPWAPKSNLPSIGIKYLRSSEN